MDGVRIAWVVTRNLQVISELLVFKRSKTDECSINYSSTN